jgi:hypothetical protein
LHDLQGGEDQERLPYAAEYMWHFYNLTGVNQHQLATQWICLKDKTDKKHPYQLPVWGFENVPPSDLQKCPSIDHPVWKRQVQGIVTESTNKCCSNRLENRKKRQQSYEA